MVERKSEGDCLKKKRKKEKKKKKRNQKGNFKVSFAYNWFNHPNHPKVIGHGEESGVKNATKSALFCWLLAERVY